MIVVSPINSIDQARAPLEQEQSPLAELPMFLIVGILQRLGNPQDILAVGATCRLYHVVSQDNQVWRSLFFSRFQTPIPKGTCTEEGACLIAYKCHYNFMERRYATRNAEGFVAYAYPLIQGNGNLIGGQFDGTIVVCDSKSGACKGKLKGHKAAVSSFVWADGNLISSSGDNTLKVWDVETGQCIETHEGNVSPLLGWIDGHLITFPSASAIRITNLKTKEFREVELNAGQGCRSLVCIDKYLILVSKKGMLTIRDFITWEKNEIIPEQTDVRSLLEDNGNLVLGYDSGMIKIWDMRSGECIKTLYGHRHCVKSLQWASGKLLSLDIHGKFIFWDLVTGGYSVNQRKGLCSLLWANENLILDFGDGGIQIRDYNASFCDIFAEMARLFRKPERLSHNEAIQRFSRMPKQVKEKIYSIYQALTNSANRSVEKAFLSAGLAHYRLQAQAIEEFLKK